jgi:hypothetical protein
LLAFWFLLACLRFGFSKKHSIQLFTKLRNIFAK